MDHLSDSEIIAKVQGGDKQIYSVLVQRYEQYGMRYAYGLLMHTSDAQDALNESFFKAYLSLKSLKDAQKFKTWFISILHNCCYTILSKRSKTQKNEASLESAIPTLPDTADAPGERDAVQRLLKNLEPKERDALLLKYAYGWDYRQISRLLKVKEGTLYSLVSRAKEKLRAAKTEWCKEEES